MRLPDVDRGDTVRSRALIRFISVITGMRLPDAARVALYHADFVGPALGAWTQAVMRGPSGWTVAERELMAAMVARWNSCAFCVGAHRAIAIRGLDPAVVDACLADHRTSPVAPALRATLSFLEKLTAAPDELGADDAREAFAAGRRRRNWPTRPPWRPCSASSPATPTPWASRCPLSASSRSRRR